MQALFICYSYLSDSTRTWESHFRFARAASAYKIQHLGSQAGLPTLEDVDDIRGRFGGPLEAPHSGLPASLMPAMEDLELADRT
jgi:hypothetical protein